MLGLDMFKLRLRLNFEEENGVIQPGSFVYRERWTYWESYWDDEGGSFTDYGYTTNSNFAEGENSWDALSDGHCSSSTGFVGIAGGIYYSTYTGFSQATPSWELDGSCDAGSMVLNWDLEGSEAEESPEAFVAHLRRVAGLVG